MSQAAYERLLRANELLAQGDRDNAVEAYRDVLRMNPTPQQRQVAEEQLRVMGSLPYTFATSGKVIRKAAAPRVERSERFERSDRNDRFDRSDRSDRNDRFDRNDRNDRPVRNDRPDRPERIERVERTERQGARVPLDDLRPHDGYAQRSGYGAQRPTAGPSNNPAGVPLSRSEKILSVLDNLFKPNEPEQTPDDDDIDGNRNYRVGKRTPPPPKKRPFSEPERPRTQQDDRWGKREREREREDDDRSRSKKAKKPKMPEDAPKPPRVRPNESAEAYENRRQRYQVWLKFQERYPHIDVNTADRLNQEGWTLKQLREAQQGKRREQSRKRKAYLEGRLDATRDYPGSQILDSWTQSKDLVWIWGVNDPRIQGRMMEVHVFHCIVRGKSRKKRRVHKLEMQALAPLPWRDIVLSNARIDEDFYATRQLPSFDPQERPTLSEDWEKAGQGSIYLRLSDGSWIKGTISWSDPYQIGLLLDCDESPCDEEIELFVFRHTLTKVSRQQPDGWEQMPLAIDVLSHKHSPSSEE